MRLCCQSNCPCLWLVICSKPRPFYVHMLTQWNMASPVTAVNPPLRCPLCTLTCRGHTLLACSFQHVNMKQRGSCSTSEQDWSPCCSFYWMCCITDSQLMKWVSVNTDVFFSQQMVVIFVELSVKRTVCVDGGWAVSWGSRGWSSSSLCVERLGLGLVALTHISKSVMKSFKTSGVYRVFWVQYVEKFIFWNPSALSQISISVTQPDSQRGKNTGHQKPCASYSRDMWAPPSCQSPSTPVFFLLTDLCAT